METGTETGTEREGRCGRNGKGKGKTGRPAQAELAAGSRDENSSVGGGYVGVPGILRGGGCQLGSAPIPFGMEETRYWSWR